MANPHEIVFLELRRIAVGMDSDDSGSSGGRFFPPIHRSEWAWLQPLTFRRERDLPFANDADIKAYHGMRFEGWKVTCNHPPRPFQVHGAADPNDGKRPSAPRGPKRPSAPEDVRQQFLRDHPWLGADDLAPPMPSRGNAHSAGNHGMAPQDHADASAASDEASSPGCEEVEGDDDGNEAPSSGCEDVEGDDDGTNGPDAFPEDITHELQAIRTELQPEMKDEEFFWVKARMFIVTAYSFR